MRISDWSSDVCSSDLIGFGHAPELQHSDTIFGSECLGHRPGDGRAPNHEALEIADPRPRSVEMSEVQGPDRRHTTRKGDALFVDQVGKTGTVHPVTRKQIGRASCRERVCHYV